MKLDNDIGTGDNTQVIVTGMGGRRAFDLAMELLFADQGYATHYQIKKIVRNLEYDIKPTELFEDHHECMIFYWHKDTDTVPLPYNMTFRECADLAWGWLQKQNYGETPDHDGSNDRGWAVFNESWGHIDNSQYGIGAVSPQWIWIGK